MSKASDHGLRLERFNPQWAQEAVLNSAQRFEFVWMVRSKAASPSR